MTTIRITNTLMRLALLCVSVVINFFANPAVSNAMQVNTIRFNHLTIEDGLSHHIVGYRGNNIIQDKKGYLWFGTSDGLNRFDGSDFKIFRHNSNEPSTLSHSNIFSLLEGSDGYIWVATRKGLNRFDPITEQFSQHLDTFADIGFNDLAEDKDGRLWLASTKIGLVQFNPKTKAFKHYQHNENDPTSISNNVVYDVHVDKEGTIWAGTENGLNRFDFDTNQFKRYFRNNADPNSISSNTIVEIKESRAGVLWFGTYNGLNRFDKIQQRFTSFLKKNRSLQSVVGGEVHSIFFDHQGQIWVSIYNKGLCLFNLKIGRCSELYYHDTGESTSLPNDRHNMIFQDRQQTIWVASDDGLSHFHPNQKHFNYLPHKVKVDGRIVKQSIYALLHDSQGRLWVGGLYGLSRYDANSTEFTHFRHNPSKPNSISGDFVFSILEDSNKDIWVAAHGGHLSRYDPQHEHFVRYPSSPTRIFELYEAPDGRFWIGDGRGLFELDRSSNRFINHSEILGITSAVEVIRADHLGGLWLGNYKELRQINPDFSYQVYKYDKKDPDSLSHPSTIALYEDKQHRLWIGTANGLNLFDRQSKTFKRFYINQVTLPNLDIVSGITEDKNGNLWLNTGRGFAKFDPVSREKRLYTRRDGLLNEYSTRAFTHARSGEVLYGGPHGITRFIPEKIIDDTVRPRIIFTGLKSVNDPINVGKIFNGQVLLPKAITQLEVINFNDHNNSFSISFSALKARHAKDLTYSYHLKGWDKAWLETSFNNREARYNNVAAGNYVLEVSAKDAKSQWQESFGSIEITISPPWWQTYWAIVGYGAILFISIYFLMQFRMRYLMRKTERLEQKIKERTAEIVQQKETIEKLLHRKDILFANVSHEFRTPITLISVPIMNTIKAFANKNIKKNLEPALINVTRLKKMVDQLIDLARLDVQPLEHNTVVDLACILDYTVSSLQGLIESRALNLKKLWQRELWVNASHDTLEKIVVNLLSNAIKYTAEKGSINVDAAIENEQVHLRISDSGIGIDPSNHERIFERFTRIDNLGKESVPGAGIGLALVKQLVETLGGSIQVSSQLNAGASFIVILPLAKDIQKNSSELLYSKQAKDIVQQELELLSNEKTETIVQEKTVADDKSNRPKILIVEDHPEMLNLLKETLSVHYDCLLAREGKDAIQKALQEVPELIITDLMMPGISGIELSEKIRKDLLTSHIPIILLTAKSDLESRLSAWESNIDEFIEKPFNTDELLLRCRNLLAIRRIIGNQLARNISNFNSNNQVIDDKNRLSLLNDKDQHFLKKLDKLVASNYKTPAFGVKEITKVFVMSESQLHRKMKALLNQSASEYVRNYRLLKATELLRGDAPVAQIAIDVGFSSSSYFSTCFKAYFGLTPKQYQLKGLSNSN